jgi:hypothetical protein
LDIRRGASLADADASRGQQTPEGKLQLYAPVLYKYICIIKNISYK